MIGMWLVVAGILGNVTLLLIMYYLIFRRRIFSSTVPSGSRAFQMPTCPASASAASASTLRGGRANLRNASVTFSLFCMKLLWDDITNIS